MSQPEPTSSSNNQKKKHNSKSTIITLIASALILISAIAGGAYIVKSTPEAKRQQRPRQAPLVEIQQLESTIEQVRIKAMGTVIPASELNLKTEVSGRVIAISNRFDLGNRVARGEKLLLLEPADYQLAVAQAESKVAEAAYNLILEKGNQEIALREWELYDNKDKASQQDKDLALRKPHRVKAQAEYKAAEAELTQAKLDLDRTVLYAPFNSMIITKSAEPGSYLSAQDSVATLVNTDRYWVQVSVPADQLSWIRIPQDNEEEGSTVQISDGSNRKVGKVYRLLGDLEENGRMARLLVEITDPLDLKKPVEERIPLLLGKYVRVEIDGKMMENVVSISRSALHDGDKLWLMNEQQQLQITQADIIWKGSEQVFIRNVFPQNIRLITSNLSTPVSGMKVRTKEPQRIPDIASREINHD